MVRVDAVHVGVSTQGPRGSKFVERYGLRNGLRAGGGTVAELVRADPEDSATKDLLVRQTRQIDMLYRRRSRRRGDTEALRELHGAISAYLEERSAPTGARA